MAGGMSSVRWRLVGLALAVVATLSLLLGFYLINQSESKIEGAVESCAAPWCVPPSVGDYPAGVFGSLLQILSLVLLVVNVLVIYFATRAPRGGSGANEKGPRASRSP